MTNEEKKQYILDAHKLMMKYHIANNEAPLKVLKILDDKHWNEFSTTLLSKQPIKLYRYYSVDNEYTIDNFDNDYVWFSHPDQFNDSVDSSINIDVLEELDYMQMHLEKITSDYSKKFIAKIAEKYNIDDSEININECIECFNDGSINEEQALKYLQKKLSSKEVDNCMMQIKKINNTNNLQLINYAVGGFLKTYLNFNDRIKTKIMALCLSEERDNDAMWGLYAKEGRGFCIEYDIPYNTIESQRLRTNLLPIYYGNKKHISINEILMRCVFCDDQSKVINGLQIDDYRAIILSMQTKKYCWRAENEWRITLTPEITSNLHKFPYASAIILGERISQENKKKLIAIAKRKNIDIFERQISRCGSSVREFKL